MFQHFDDLRCERQETDAAMLGWAANVMPEWLESTMEYRSLVDGKLRRLPAAVAAVVSFQPRDASPRAVDDTDEAGRRRARRDRLAVAAGNCPDARLIRMPTWRLLVPYRADRFFWREDAPRRKPSPDVGSRGARTPACWRCSRVRAIPAPRASLPRSAPEATRMSAATCADARGVSPLA